MNIELMLKDNGFNLLKESSSIKKIYYKGPYRVNLEDDQLYQIFYNNSGWGNSKDELFALFALLQLPPNQRIKIMQNKHTTLNALYTDLLEKNEDDLSKSKLSFVRACKKFHRGY